jgi:peptidoglycan/xylan/chitin deacetylase (PgdA/CDA1 family)
LFEQALFSAVNSPASSKVLGVLERVNERFPNLLRVLTYHRIEETNSDPSAYHRVTVTPEKFDRQMQFLGAHYRVLSMADLLEANLDRRRLPPSAVIVTFDDAYKDFATYAWPILKKYHIPVTLFVPTAFPDHPERVFWWDRIHYAIFENKNLSKLNTDFGCLGLKTDMERKHAFDRIRETVKSLPHKEAMDWVDEICSQLSALPKKNHILGWDDLRRLATAGVTLGAHTRNHPMMDRISIEVTDEEIEGSLMDLKRETGASLPIFAYPGGQVTDGIEERLRRMGIMVAFSTNRGVNDLKRVNWMRLNRINVGPRTTLPVLRAQLLPWSSYF